MSTIYMDMQSISPKMEIYDYNNIVVRLSGNEGVNERDDAKFFNQRWMPFAFAAILGFINDKSYPLKGEFQRDVFKYSTINNNSGNVFQSLVLFAIAKKGYKILENPSEINKTIEEYANGGFEILYEILSNTDNFDSPPGYIKFIYDILKEE